ncbi:MAG: DUF2867 domain-containing protein [Acidobacteriota bacterium]
MRLATDEHRRHDWWVHNYAKDFELLDLWQYPIESDRADDFETFLEVHDMMEMVKDTSVAVRALFAVRLVLGKIFRWDGPPVDDGPTRAAGSIAGFDEVYRDDRELVLRTENATVTALMHLGWVPLEGDGTGEKYTAQLAVYAISKGRVGRAYMALISPFRHGLVYPALMRAGRRRWLARPRTAA